MRSTTGSFLISFRNSNLCAYSLLVFGVLRRLHDDMFSKEDVVDFVDFLKGSVRVRGDLLYSSPNTARLCFILKL